MELFGTAGIRGDVTTTVTPSLALAVGSAAAVDGETFVVGRDGRESGQALVAAVEAGIASGGAEVVRVGRVPTPALAYASRGRRGVMVTASHNPPQDNGLKLFVDGTEYDRTAEEAVESRVDAETELANWDTWGDSTREEVLDDYRNAVVEYTRRAVGDCENTKIAVDCGNGMASVATPQVLRALGADVVALNANVDGHFPGRESKPTPESLEDLRAFVADGDFEFGIGHDGDADRIVIVDERGEVVHEDTVLAMLAGFYTRQSDAADPVVVTTPNASARIDEHVESHGGRIERVRLGALHEGVATARNTGTADTDVVFAAEPWKHVHTDFGPWIDGVASAAVVGALVARDGLPDLKAPITERPYRKVSVDCPDDRKAATMDALETRLPETFPEASVDTEYGVRLTFDDAAWTLVRPSGTEPYVRIYAESEDVEALVDEVTDVVTAAIDDVS
ncbi:phosphopentomutase/phosphoglucosamine mutase [Natronomonas gomsonensis]|uniref:phosphopentomutase/phosphoglucosamine mutase n=1 Tax=Natronomonas gomsonensis TaxID=1046043 RepID=UPI0015BE92DE|nr:phosphopentomutase/phosphoglucosamine mutase [Natronomonas gomsonensis]